MKTKRKTPGKAPAGKPGKGTHEPIPRGEPVGNDPLPCTIKICASPAQRSFSPPRELSGKETFKAVLNRPLAPGETIRWSVRNGPRFGSVEFGSPDSLTTEVRARKPNRTVVAVQLRSVEGRVLCEDRVDVSVPQFFFVRALPGFTASLQDFGLQIPIGGNGPSILLKNALNGLIVTEASGKIIDAARSLFRDVNVRFTTRDPTAAVGAGNFSNVLLRGRGRIPGVLGSTPRDPRNLNGGDEINVFTREVSYPTGTATRSPTAQAIFGGVAIRRLMVVNGVPALVARPGRPVGVGEFVADREKATTFRQLQVNAAFLALSLLLGSTVAHECGHTLGLVLGGAGGHNTPATGNLMDSGLARGFRARTGIYRFNPAFATLARAQPRPFSLVNLGQLQQILPIFR